MESRDIFVWSIIVSKVYDKIYLNKLEIDSFCFSFTKFLLVMEAGRIFTILVAYKLAVDTQISMQSMCARHEKNHKSLCVNTWLHLS